MQLESEMLKKETNSILKKISFYNDQLAKKNKRNELESEMNRDLKGKYERSKTKYESSKLDIEEFHQTMKETKHNIFQLNEVLNKKKLNPLGNTIALQEDVELKDFENKMNINKQLTRTLAKTIASKEHKITTMEHDEQFLLKKIESIEAEIKTLEEKVNSYEKTLDEIGVIKSNLNSLSENRRTANCEYGK